MRRSIPLCTVESELERAAQRIRRLIRTHVINGGGVSRRGFPLVRLEDVVGGALAVVAPPLGALGRVVGPFARTSRVGGVVLGAQSLVHAGESHVTHQ